MVFAELVWNPGQLRQAEDRAHRVGQQSTVHVSYLLARNTADEIMWGTLNRKLEVGWQGERGGAAKPRVGA